MQKIEAIVRPEKLEDVKDALAKIGVGGLNVVHVTGRGSQRSIVHMGRGQEPYEVDMLPRVKIEGVVPDDQVDQVVDTICEVAHTGRVGDGKIFIIPVADAIRVRTRERGDEAL
jgi:nitrogen regulatory protein P-II 1